MDITDSIDETGSFNPYMVCCLLAAWTIVCLGMFRGIKTSVKVTAVVSLKRRPFWICGCPNSIPHKLSRNAQKAQAVLLFCLRGVMVSLSLEATMRGIGGMSGLKYVPTFKGIIPLVCSDVEDIFPGESPPIIFQLLLVYHSNSSLQRGLVKSQIK